MTKSVGPARFSSGKAEPERARIDVASGLLALGSTVREAQRYDRYHRTAVSGILAMNPTNSATLGPRHLLGALATSWKRGLWPAILLTAAVGVYALVRPDTWEASQALIVRNEATTRADTPGRFTQPEEMKTVQETILELARSSGVLTAALSEVGPPANYRRPEQWPTPRDVAELRDVVKLTPPKGAEFGKTEVFYLKVRDCDRSRAIALAEAITKHLEAGFQQLRDAKAQSMMDELSKAVHLSAGDLKAVTDQLTQIESEVGSDLAELRILHDSNAGESALRRTMTEIRNELRLARSERATFTELLVLLHEAEKDPRCLLATPSRLLESQPALRQMKDGLVAAALLSANLQGRMNDAHPLVRAAEESQRQIRENFHRELPVAIRGIEAELRLNADRVALLEDQLDQVTQRLERLATLRASYSNQLAEAQSRKVLLERAEDRLADARTSQATANIANLITRIDRPDTGTDPLGPSRAVLVLMGLAAGVLCGIGIVLLTAPLPQETAASSAPSRTEPAGPTSAKAPRFSGEPVSLAHALSRLQSRPVAPR